MTTDRANPAPVEPSEGDSSPTAKDVATELTDLVTQAAQLNADIKAKEAENKIEVDRMKGRLRALKSRFRDVWMESKIKNIKCGTTHGNYTGYLAKEYYVSCNKNDLPELIAWLRATNRSGMIEETVPKIGTLCKELELAGHELPPKVSIHRDTVVKFLKTR